MKYQNNEIQATTNTSLMITQYMGNCLWCVTKHKRDYHISFYKCIFICVYTSIHICILMYRKNTRIYMYSDYILEIEL